MKKAILKTLAYSDIFSYPLKTSEIWKFLIWEEKAKKPKIKTFKKSLKSLLKSKTIEEEKNFFCLNGRKTTTKKRLKLKKINEQKLKTAKNFSQKLSRLPWIKAILLTGALALKNSEENDDIDFLVITSPKRLWLTRLSCIFLAEILRVRRRPKDTKIKDKICLNLFLTEKNLKIPLKKQNLFIAHEIVQAKPLVKKDKTYEKFIKENLWIKKYLPNAIKLKDNKLNTTSKKKDPASCTLDFFETLFFKIQTLYMRSKKTTEEVSEKFAFFHPKSNKSKILRNYTRKIKSLGV
jgi:D-beta-D-heptose 7-phosphate kinase/D-beta-D-heptose 1-phosphate adenosyltransferase